MLVAIGEEAGKVIFRFPHPTNEFVCEPENARLIAEQIAKSAYIAHYGRQPEQRSLIGESMRKSMKGRATIVIRSLMEAGKSPGYIADHITDLILKEVA